MTGLIAIGSLGVILIGLSWLDNHGIIRLKKLYLYSILGLIVGVGLWYIFSQTIGMFF